MILSSVDKSVSVNGDSDCGRETRQLGLGFQGCMFSSVMSLVVVPESYKHLLMLWVRSGVRVDGCQDRVGSLSVKNLSMSKKKWKGAWLGNQH